MNKPTVIKATVCAWLSSSYGPQDLEGDPQRAISNLTLYQPYDERGKKNWQSNGYVIVEQKVESLRAEQTRVLADAHAKATGIEADIQKLLAISYEAPEVAA